MEQIEPRQMLSGTEFGGAGESLAGGEIPTPNQDAGLVAFGNSLSGLQVAPGALHTGGGGSVVSGSLAEGELINAPAAPYNFAATTVSTSEINLMWSLGDATETAIVIERKSGSTGVFQTLVTLPPGENTFTDTSCWAATDYTYRVSAVNGGGSSGFSSEQSAVTKAIPAIALNTVTDLRAIANSPNSVAISFTDANPPDNDSSTFDPVPDYFLERSSDGMSYQVIKTLGTSVTWTDVGRSPGATYYYRVRSISWDRASSDYSAPAQVTMPSRPIGAPIEPSGLESSSAAATSITLNWTNNDPSDPLFRIDRAAYTTWRALTWSTVATTVAGATSFTDVGLTPESAYVYRVSAMNDHGSSGYAVPSSDVMQSIFGDGLAVITASAGTGSPMVYDIGPEFSLKKIADLDWSKLGPGDTVNIHYKAEGYHELFTVSTRGTAENWITINGVPDPITGALPVIDGLEAVLAPQFRSSAYDVDGGGAIVVGTRPGYSDGYKPGYLTIQNLQIQRCFTGNSPNTFTNYDKTQATYGRVGAGIYIYRADHVTIRDCVVTENGEGIFGAGQSGFDRLMTDITISSNHIFNNGNIGFDREHNTYIEAVDVIYEFNQYGPMRSGAGGNGLKDRSVGVVVRGNYIEGGSHELQLVGAENQQELAVTIPRYHRAIVYGNTIVDGPTSVSGPVEYGGEVQGAYDRKGILYLYGNTIVIRADKSEVWKVNVVNMFATEETLDARNNIIAAVASSPGVERPDLGLLGVESYFDRKANAYFGRNWVPPGYLLNCYGDGFTGHVEGLENLLVGSSDNPGFVDLEGGDFHLAADSAAIDRGGRLAGSTLAYPLDRQYLAPHGSIARTTSGAAVDLGAYENVTFPLIYNPGNKRNTGGDAVSLTVEAVGAETFTAVGLPTGLSINNSGQISGTIDIEASGSFDVVVSASDSKSTNQVRFSWIVDLNPVNIPQLTNPGNQQNTGGDEVNLTITSYRASTFAAVGLPKGLSIGNSGQISGTIDPYISGNFEVVVTAGNPLATAQVKFNWIVDLNPDYVHQPPSDIDLSSAIVADRSLGAAVGLVTVTDADPDDTHTLVVSDARFEIVERQLRLKADKSLVMDTEPTVVVAITATDRYGLSLTQNFAISVVKIAVIDDGDTGFSTVGTGWTRTTSLVKGYQSDVRYVSAGDGKKTATWARTVAPGTYTIQASWSGYSNSVTNAPYRIYDGSTLLAEMRFDQKRTPSYALNDPAAFMTIATVDVAGGNLRVVLGNDASGGTLVVADAVRIIPGTPASIPDKVDGPCLVDDGEAGYAESAYGWYSIGSWKNGVQSDSRFVAAGDGRSTATWAQSVAPGSYTIQASWYGNRNNVRNAPYRIYDGDTLVREVRVDQRYTPARVTGVPALFMTLATVNINSGTLRVVLANDASGGSLVEADAVRVVANATAQASAAASAATAKFVSTTNTATVSSESIQSYVSASDQLFGGADAAWDVAPLPPGESHSNSRAAHSTPVDALAESQSGFESWDGTDQPLSDPLDTLSVKIVNGELSADTLQRKADPSGENT